MTERIAILFVGETGRAIHHTSIMIIHYAPQGREKKPEARLIISSYQIHQSVYIWWDRSLTRRSTQFSILSG